VVLVNRPPSTYFTQHPDGFRSSYDLLMRLVALENACLSSSWYEGRVYGRLSVAICRIDATKCNGVMCKGERPVLITRALPRICIEVFLDVQI
jgi:hypothetical protein